MAKGKKSAKKEFRTKIAEQLTTVFGDLKERISTKDFERKIKKASRILSQGIKPGKQKEKVEKKKTEKVKQIATDTKTGAA